MPANDKHTRSKSTRSALHTCLPFDKHTRLPNGKRARSRAHSATHMCMPKDERVHTLKSTRNPQDTNIQEANTDCRISSDMMEKHAAHYQPGAQNLSRALSPSFRWLSTASEGASCIRRCAAPSATQAAASQRARWRRVAPERQTWTSKAYAIWGGWGRG